MIPEKDTFRVVTWDDHNPPEACVLDAVASVQRDFPGGHLLGSEVSRFVSWIIFYRGLLRAFGLNEAPLEIRCAPGTATGMRTVLWYSGVEDIVRVGRQTNWITGFSAVISTSSEDACQVYVDAYRAVNYKVGKNWHADITHLFGEVHGRVKNSNTPSV